MATTLSWPGGLGVARCAVGLQRSAAQFRSPFSGSFQASSFNADRLTLSLTLRPFSRAINRTLPGQVEALLFALASGADYWVAAWHFARPQPVGTMRGSPTLSATANRGDASLAITGGTASSTLEAGDMLGAGGQLFMVRTAVTLNGSGAGTVQVVNRVRATIASSSAVTWNAPTDNFAMPSTTAAVVHVPALLDGAAFDLEQVW